MTLKMQAVAAEALVYPESDGRPIADNTEQFRWIMTIQGGLDALFQNDPVVFVAGDLLWYPVEGKPKKRCAPDAMVVFGRPKGDRGSYLQWKEDNIPPQVVFEVLSPGNTTPEMERKLQFYTMYGVEEYYLYDPTTNTLKGWERKGDLLQRINPINGWVSPWLGIKFALGAETLTLYHPTGEPFRTFVELSREYEEERQAREQAQVQTKKEREAREQAQVQTEKERQAREQAQSWAEQALIQAEKERQAREQAQVQTEKERQAREQAQNRAEQAEQRAAQLAAKLRALGLDPDA